MDRPLVVLDTECASQHGAPHLVEVGAVRVADGEAVESFSRLVRPQVPIDPEATAVHGIDDDDVRTAGDAGEVLAEFFAWIGSDWMVAHRAEADAWTLGFEATRYGLALPTGPILDTLKLARELIPESSDHKLDTLAQHLDLEEGGRHRALPDAVACWMVLEECARRSSGGASLADLFVRCAPLTLPKAAPRTPRIPPRLRPLEIACRQSRRVHLLYGDPSSTPAWLEVGPRILYQRSRKGYLEAECARSGLLKTYRLDRVHAVRD